MIFATGFFMVVGFITWVVTSTIVNGWVLSTLWGWLIVPTFHVQPLTIPAAIGLSLIAGYFTMQPSKKGQEENSISYLIIFGLVKWIFALLIGYIVHFWI